MLAIMQPQLATRDRDREHNINSPSMGIYRPARPSPLSSSPIRAASPSSPPTSRIFSSPPPPLAAAAAAAAQLSSWSAFAPPHSPTRSTRLRETQSSPISFPSSSSSTSSSALRANRLAADSNGVARSARPGAVAFKYATRPVRQTPFSQRRDAAQEGRRRVFLSNVKRRSEDQKWERRGGDQELEKLEWISENRDWQRAKARDENGVIYEYEIDEAGNEDDDHDAPLSTVIESREERGMDDDMVDVMEAEEEGYEHEAIAVMTSSIQHTTDQHDPTRFSDDDDDYDALFVDYLSQRDEVGSSSQDFALSQQMDMS